MEVKGKVKKDKTFVHFNSLFNFPFNSLLIFKLRSAAAKLLTLSSYFLRHLKSDCLEPTVHSVNIKTTGTTSTTINRHLQCLIRPAQYVSAQSCPSCHSCLHKILAAGGLIRELNVASREMQLLRRASQHA